MTGMDVEAWGTEVDVAGGSSFRIRLSDIVNENKVEVVCQPRTQNRRRS